MNKKEWKKLHRQLRIIRRETVQAAHDCLLFGTGFYRTGPDVKDWIEKLDHMEIFYE
jgi:hypothetical protein